MKRRIVLKSLVILGVLLSACQSGQKKSDSKILLMDSFEIIESIKSDNTDFIESCDFVKLELTDQSMINNIDQLQIYDSYIYILDKKQKCLMTFDKNGRFSHIIGGVGGGPEELIAPSVFYINNENQTVSIFDAMASFIITYKLTGEFVDKKPLDPNIFVAALANVSYLKGNKLVCYANPNVVNNNELYILNGEDYTLSTKLLLSDVMPSEGIFRTAKQPYSVVNDEVHFVSMFNPVINCWKKGEINPLYVINDGKEIATAESLNTIMESSGNNYFMFLLKLISDGKYSYGFIDLFETDRFMCCLSRGENYSEVCVIMDKHSGRVVRLHENSSVEPYLTNIIYSNQDTFVRIWENNDMLFLKSEVASNKTNPQLYSKEALNILNNIGLEDNPVLILFKMKQ